MPIIRFIKNLKNKMKKAKKIFKKENNNDNTINHVNIYLEDINHKDIDTINHGDKHEYEKYYDNSFYKKNYVPTHAEAVNNGVKVAKKILKGYI